MSSKRRATQAKHRIFWGEIAPSEHVVHIYGEDEEFLRSLEVFVGEGLGDGEAVIVIATAEHVIRLGLLLEARGIDLDAARAEDRYIPIDADEALTEFMVNEWPDERLFTGWVMRLVKRGRRNGRQVRAFGEMVAILWRQGHNGATVRLEHLWHRFCETEAFCLYCAYPRIGFTQNAEESIREICAAHSRVLAG